MADIYGSHFEYGGVLSRQYGLIIATVNAGRMSKLNGDISGSTVFSKIAQKRYLVGDDMSSSPLSFDVEIITDNERGIEQSERRAIEKWLFNKHDYRRLYFDMADDCFDDMTELIDGIHKRLYLNCRFVNPEKLEYNGGIVGYKATLEADSNMFWQDAIEKTFTVNNESESATSIISIDVDSDIDDYIYPKVTFTLGSVGGDVTFINNSDDSTRLTKFVGLSSNATIAMKGELNYISGQNYQKFSTRNFVRLLDGTNNITVQGNVKTVKVEFQNRRNF